MVDCASNDAEAERREKVRWSTMRSEGKRRISRREAVVPICAVCVGQFQDEDEGSEMKAASWILYISLMTGRSLQVIEEEEEEEEEGDQ